MKFASIRCGGRGPIWGCDRRGLYCSVSKFPTLGEFNRSDLRAGLTAAGESG